MAKATFRLRVVSLLRTLFDGDVTSVMLTGDEGEYELLPYHYPLMGALLEGEIKVANEPPIEMKTGVVMFDQNTCIIIVEEFDTEKKLFSAPEEDEKNQEEESAA